MASALGIAWILDGLEVTVVASLAAALASPHGLNLSSTEVGMAASAYVTGAVAGSLVFGHLADRLGRKPLFFVTLGVYVTSAILSGLAWNFASFAVFRFITGAGIGGEYSAINSAIQEFTPAARRGQVDLVINGSFWVGTGLGALGSVAVLNLLPQELGWRFAFIIGGVLAAIVIVLRRFVPESPRWLLTHGKFEQAESIVSDIESRIVLEHGALPPVAARFTFLSGFRLTLGSVAETLLKRYPKRVVLGLVLMATQAFFYNAIFFTYALVLTRFYAIDARAVGWFILPFAAGNFLGPLLLGSLFDSLGRKTMIAATYAIAGASIVVLGILFRLQALGAAEQTLGWAFVFFFASAGASAAYLTVGESFPLEMRALAIALFYAFGTALGGIAGPTVFGRLIEHGTRSAILAGYVLGGVLMLAGAAVELMFGIKAERRALEDVAAPLSILESRPPPSR
jgi:MFS family permease